jgi:hypothetical protein
MFVKHLGNAGNAIRSLFLEFNFMIILYLCEFKHDAPDDRHIDKQYCDLILNHILIV